MALIPKNYRVVGNYFHQDYTTLANLSNYTANTPGGDTSSWTLTGGFLRAVRSDTNLGFLNYLKFNGFSFINSKYWSITVVFDTKVNNANSYGIGFGFMSAASNVPVSATDGFLRADINCSTSGNGTVTLRCQGVATAGSPTVTQVANDRIMLNITRNNHELTVNCQNITSLKSTTPVVTQTTIISRATTTNWDNSTLVPYMYLLGGTYDVVSLTMSTPLYKYCDGIFIGDSITHGMFMGSRDRTYPEIIADLSNKKYYNFASQSTITADWVSSVTEILALSPKCVYIMLGRNDISSGVLQSVTLANIATIVAAIVAAGLDYRIISVLPSGASLNTAIVNLNTALSAAYTTKFLDIFSAFDGGGGVIKYQLQSGDGTHLMAPGQIEAAKQLVTLDPTFFM